MTVDYANVGAAHTACAETIAELDAEIIRLRTELETARSDLNHERIKVERGTEQLAEARADRDAARAVIVAKRSPEWADQAIACDLAVARAEKAEAELNAGRNLNKLQNDEWAACVREVEKLSGVAGLLRVDLGIAEAENTRLRKGLEEIAGMEVGHQEWLNHGPASGRMKDIARALLESGETSAPKSVVCPFCNEDDFDLPGLRGHIGNGWCPGYSAPFPNSEGP